MIRVSLISLLITIFTLTSALAFGAYGAPAGTDSHLEEKSAHVHVSLVGLPGAKEMQGNFDGLGEVMRRDGFFGSSASSVEHPWTPCSVLAAGILGAYMNAFWWTIERDAQTAPPPPNTNILGKFDDKLKDGKIPRKDPAETAEIVARLVIWRSGGINVQANTLFSAWTQRECLEALLKKGPEYVRQQMDKFGSKQTLLHLSPLSQWSATINWNDTEKYLGEMRIAGFLATVPLPGGNPLAPCSLLTEKRLGSRLNELWGEILQGRIEPPHSTDPFLKDFLDDLKKGAISMDDPARAAEITARLFATKIVGANIVSRIFASESTQEQCLEEIFTPGTIRKRLIREGKLPLR